MLDLKKKRTCSTVTRLPLCGLVCSRSLTRPVLNVTALRGLGGVDVGDPVIVSLICVSNNCFLVCVPTADDEISAALLSISLIVQKLSRILLTSSVLSHFSSSTSVSLSANTRIISWQYNLIIVIICDEACSCVSRAFIKFKEFFNYSFINHRDTWQSKHFICLSESSEFRTGL